ncbi:TRAP transporter substrate-binding protein DctP [Dehalococcoidia bacterium]|nr:TRAP transporter substrate-binding protein DctP [Dehalococcoidia bacterium]
MSKVKVSMVLLLTALMVMSGLAMGCPPPPPPEVLPTFHLSVAQAMVPKEALTHLNLIEMTERITQRTDGRITWDIFGPEIGDWTELELMTRKGAIDLQFNAFATGLDPRWNIIFLPFMVTNFEDVKKISGPGGPFEELGTIFARDGGVHYLAPFLNSVGMLGLNTDPIMTPEQAKGVMIRVPPLEVFKIYVEHMGFTPVTIPWAEAPAAIGVGIADGWVGSGSMFHYRLFRDVARTQMVTFDFIEIWAISMNLEMWNALPEEFQRIIEEEANRMSIKRLGQVEEEELMYRQKLIDHGWTIVDMAKYYPDELRVWKELAREAWVVLEPIVGRYWLDKFMNAMREVGIEI